MKLLFYLPNEGEDFARETECLRPDLRKHSEPLKNR